MEYSVPRGNRMMPKTLGNTFTLGTILSDVDAMVSLARLPALPCRSLSQERWHQMPAELRAVAEAEPMHQPRWQVPHRTALLTWILLILVPSAAFLVVSTLAISQGSLLVVPLVATFLLLLSTTFMTLTSCSNPGIIPRPSVEKSAQLRGPPPAVIINGMRVQTKFCHVCGIVRPPRASHCRVTDRCIERWDHYCPWVGTAVGRNNYRWFLLFVLCTFGLSTFVASRSMWHIRLLTGQFTESAAHGSSLATPALGFATPPDMPAVLRAVAAAPLSGVLSLYGTIVSLLLSLLLSYHAYLVAINQTTYENVRGTYHARATNPFDNGLVRNTGEVFCPSCYPPAEPELEADTLDSIEGGRAGAWLHAARGGASSTGNRDRHDDGARVVARSAAASRALEAVDRQEAMRWAALKEQLEEDEQDEGQHVSSKGGVNSGSIEMIEMTISSEPVGPDDDERHGMRHSSGGVSADCRDGNESNSGRPEHRSPADDGDGDDASAKQSLGQQVAIHVGPQRFSSPEDEPPPSPTSEPGDRDSDGEPSAEPPPLSPPLPSSRLHSMLVPDAMEGTRGHDRPRC